ncbi:hypothetical protein LTR10_019586 [Elasticomyces elasticus]|uniref:RRM domain-containing protein n=1 Tax=Exophiala sideris TaxID=1016849 RepID=A0ABR0JNT3_9EURO|nr:hypothetical protein LTR10_019586 [Elasticomyces elasticus]KAK5038147.1 hypothetical protein LTS07_001616 [Exophiala sideris]KAK5044131.1 hypothetical protein LTR13_000487 [Exophiala sideris]KAK5067631.1 hypothetical protein LTR69_001620 [Exophiala sideris]KAK5184129.1 hypothetical protein LTR44_003635 [Eurotiomycetes sp. CCFEE 6388]
MEETASPQGTGTPRQQPAWRSAASTNWRVRDESPRLEQPANKPRYGAGRSNDNASSEDAAGTRLYVGNLLYTAQKADIETLFTERGFTVTNVNISTDPFTGRNPSYCFVDLDSADEAARAISELNGVDVQGRTLKVSPGVARRGPNQGPASGQSREGREGQDGGREVRVKNYDRGYARESRDERNTEYKPTFDRWSRNDASSHWQAPQAEGRRLYVGNLPRIEPQSALDEEIQSLFATYLADEQITPTAVSKLVSPHTVRNPTAGSNLGEPGNLYYCFVDLARAEDVDVVIQKLDGQQGSWGGNLRVNRARNADRKVTREQGLRQDGGERRSSGGASAWRSGSRDVRTEEGQQ